MRRFIYLDTDTLNSYLAQIFDGLIQSHNTESENKSGTEKQNVFTGTASGDIAFKMFGKGVDASAEVSYEHLKKVADEEMYRDVQTKILHDNAFDHFFDYLKVEGLLNDNEIGNFVSVKDDFYIFDIAFYQRLFSQNGFVASMETIQNKKAQKEALQQLDTLPRDQRRDKSAKAVIANIVQEAASKTHEGFEVARILFDMLASIIPYPQVLCIANYIVVLNEQYLRDSLSTAAFKYGGKINVVGYITNKVTAQAETPVSEFAGIGNSINELMKMFFKNTDEMFIVHPVAIYYDN